MPLLIKEFKLSLNYLTLLFSSYFIFIIFFLPFLLFCFLTLFVKAFLTYLLNVFDTE